MSDHHNFPLQDSIDLAVDGKVEVRAIHPSIIGHQHCFLVSNSLETKYFSCRSEEEMSKWIVRYVDIIICDLKQINKIDSSALMQEFLP